MPQPELQPPLIILLGPTAVGKTELSLMLAEKFKGEIVSADSRLFYRGMDIGTAKPNREDRSRVIHHLIDVADPDDIWNLGGYKEAAVKIIENIHSRGKIPFLVGGSGQYLRAITQGWVIPQLKADDRMRGALLKWADKIGEVELHRRLASIDPSAAENILPNNLRRTVRALEVIFLSGRRFSEHRKRELVPYRILQIGLTREKEILFDRIGQRVDAMIESGFVKEVQNLLDQGYSPDLPSLSAIGYGQVVRYLQGSNSLAEAVEEIKRQTRKFVRRQYTWFKPNAPDIEWFDMGDNLEGEINIMIEKFLAEDV